MKLSGAEFILTDIEGTTTSVSFVYEKLFPYFRENIGKLAGMQEIPEVMEAFGQVKALAAEEGKEISGTGEIIDMLLEWDREDRKITPLKTLQGILWEEGYRSGEIRGHVYEDVPPALERWERSGMKMGVFSSGSVAAQKLIFGFSEAGDLSSYFSAYFDTRTGGKRETATYAKIAEALQTPAGKILFLSDIREELEAADEAGYLTVQLVRPGTAASWPVTAPDFNSIIL